MAIKVTLNSTKENFSENFGSKAKAMECFNYFLKKNNFKNSDVTKMQDIDLKVGSKSIGFLLKLEKNSEILCRYCATYSTCKIEKKGNAQLCRNFWEHRLTSQFIK